MRDASEKGRRDEPLALILNFVAEVAISETHST